MRDTTLRYALARSFLTGAHVRAELGVAKVGCLFRLALHAVSHEQNHGRFLTRAADTRKTRRIIERRILIRGLTRALNQV
jgi:hypothetical protein